MVRSSAHVNLSRINFFCVYHKQITSLDRRERYAYQPIMATRSSTLGLYGRIGDAVRKRRREMGLTQQNLADRLDISRASLANIEVGRQRILVHHLYDLARALGLEVAALLPRSPEPADLDVLDGLDFSPGVSLDQKRQLAGILREEDESADWGGDDEADRGKGADARSTE